MIPVKRLLLGCMLGTLRVIKQAYPETPHCSTNVFLMAAQIERLDHSYIKVS
jgi:hypothetical protein